MAQKYYILLVLASLTCVLGQINDAVVVLQATAGNEVLGIVRFSKGDAGTVNVRAHVVNLTPNAMHGFHIHVDGDITDPAGLNAGAHFNPLNQPHNCPPNDERHVGDLGNLKSDGNGTAIYAENNKLLSLDPSSDSSIIGRGMIIHAAIDDCSTQPTGNSGARIAQGVIGICGIDCTSRFLIHSPHLWNLQELYL